ncbi:MAG: hypothetical protein JO057_23090 [Chloroflexi bacterium]|nr:hypothetical protein [Chloroflexota bacterium]
MKFFFGVAVGAAAMWAYSSGKLQSVMGQAPEPVNQAFTMASERANQVANNEQVRGFVSQAQDRISSVTTPTSSEGSGGEPQSTMPVELTGTE